MNPIPVIIAREFLTRVKKKSFFLTTLLLPFVMAVLIVLPVYLAQKSERECTVFVLDDNDYFINKFQSTSKLHFEYPGETIDGLKERCIAGECDAVLHVLGGSQGNLANLYFFEEPPLSLKGELESQMNKILFDKTLVDSLHIDLRKFNVIKETSRCSVATLQIDKQGQAQAQMVELNRIAGLLCGVFLYLFLLTYATQMMRSTIEEKSNRIIEIIVSSVKPFQFLMGKIVGVGLVGLVQFVLQIALVVMLLLGTQLAAPQLFTISQTAETEVVATQGATAMSGESAAVATTQGNVFQDISAFYTFPFSTLLTLFVFFFIFGYLTYASLYAAVGSACDNETDATQFVLPISFPLILTVICMAMGLAPQGALMRCLSLIPFTSPMAMLYRIPSGVPLWEVILSAALLIGTFVLCLWFAAKTYRVGLLTFGKKVTWKDLFHWLKIS